MAPVNTKKLVLLVWTVWLCLCNQQAVAAADDTGLQYLHEQLREKVMAFYYVWYGAPETDDQYQHWNHEVLPHWDAKQKHSFEFGSRFDPPKNVHSPFYPQKGPYSSSDPATIRTHIREMVDANITGMVVSWWGPTWRAGSHDTQGVNTDQVLGLVLAEAEQQQQLKVAFHLEPYEGRSVESVRADLQHLMSQHNASQGLMRLGGRPVYFVYDSYRLPAAQWARLLGKGGDVSVRGTELDGVFIGLMLDLKEGDELLLGGFDGFYTYFASDAVSYASNPEHWQQIAEWANDHDQLFIASIGPGYDDSRIRPWNAGATRPREDGARYRRYWQLAQPAHAVSITSFNEWGEGTQIEAVQPWVDEETGKPYQDYGEGGPNLYMDITKECASHFIESRQSTSHGADYQDREL